MKEKNGWLAPESMPKSWSLANVTITGIVETDMYAWVVGKEGLLGYTKDYKNFTDVKTGTKEDFWCCLYDWVSRDIVIGATTGIYRVNVNAKSIWKYATGIDVKDMVLKKKAFETYELYVGGYEGGFYRVDDNKLVELLSPKQAPAVRSICANPEDPHDPIYVGLKSGAVWCWVDGKVTEANAFGVPGNGVMLTNGTDVLAAHRDIKYNGSKIFTVPPDAKGKTANASCGYWNGDKIKLYGEDALEIEVDCETMKAEVIRKYEKGLILSVLQSGTMEISVGSGIKDGNGIISPIVYRETGSVPPPPPPPPPNQKPVEVDLAKLAEFSNGLANAMANLGKATSDMNLKITEFYNWVKEVTK